MEFERSALNITFFLYDDVFDPAPLFIPEASEIKHPVPVDVSKMAFSNFPKIFG